MNKLSNSTSPYLLQHANNPVNWFPWGAEALQKAKDENKLILVSIGYSACHWCHVMEHESFEDKQVADVMNEHFVCIKVDREERPDIDQIYMSAVQLMTGRGGWPLNCICLPDQRPIYGGTYFKKQDWMGLLQNLADFWETKPKEAEDYAVKLTEGIVQYENISFVTEQHENTKADLVAIVQPWKQYFDFNEGGLGSAPKFPMPNNWQFLMRYAHIMKDEAAQVIVGLTLDKMAKGGIYDHVGGGFARYSVDGHWHVPHFEKMLYDNAQLVSLYSEAYTCMGDEQYRKVVAETITFVERELTSPEFGFYSALDADSEGVEGKFYTFDLEDVESILGDDAALFGIYYNVTSEGNWEEEHTNIFFRSDDDAVLAQKLGLPVERMLEKIAELKQKVLTARSKRIRPGLDYKVLASWNGLMLKGLCDAYRAFDEPAYLELALKNAAFIQDNLITLSGKITRVYDSSDSAGKLDEAVAFLDDYAMIIEAFTALYEVTFDEQWLQLAKKLITYTISYFYDESTGMFYYTPNNGEQLIARKLEIMDNVIPSSNSVMARNLYKLGLLFDDEQYLNISAQMMRNIKKLMAKYGSAYSNWAMLLLDNVAGVYEIAITGANAEARRKETEKKYIPNKIILGGTKGSLPLLADKFSDETRIFVCKDKTCRLPVTETTEAFKQIEA
ncbi:thioredoxin domain-containing protein [Mucilaginibacter sp. HMF5004]|uniref:thioredoxin domain-containing protein n=1 Tax=Mucilaginibacter rivuli TaxID=2857527 RepID=UPI001C5D8EE7|nr:thioredoxin domain-containing protein [Mucilaginibacter rivuli]MBW4891531.1 thioredoxin domain-containing protein [Mucilaginibacter rivuli]